MNSLNIFYLCLIGIQLFSPEMLKAGKAGKGILPFLRTISKCIFLISRSFHPCVPPVHSSQMLFIFHASAPIHSASCPSALSDTPRLSSREG